MAERTVRLVTPEVLTSETVTDCKNCPLQCPPQQVQMLPAFFSSLGLGLKVSIHLGHCFWIKVEDEEDTQKMVEEFRAEGYQVGLPQNIVMIFVFF